jgi:hypothetical protein
MPLETATVTDWRVVELGTDRIRWRFDGNEHAYLPAGYELQYKVGGEWRPVRNWTSRDWFALGFHAGRTAP